jgi:hypothetical protein
MRTDRARALAAALCGLAALALFAAGCGGSTKVIEKTIIETTTSGEETDGTQRASEEDSTGGGKDETPVHVVALRTFSSPTGNIGCAMYEGGARCDIRKRQWRPPPHPASCSDEVDFGQGLQVPRAGRASFVCAGDTTLDPSAPPLQYGSASAIGSTECISRSAGITCTNAAGHGFFISIQSYRLF